jgi:hypothetical protein
LMSTNCVKKLRAWCSRSLLFPQTGAVPSRNGGSIRRPAGGKQLQCCHFRQHTNHKLMRVVALLPGDLAVSVILAFTHGKLLPNDVIRVLPWLMMPSKLASHKS